MDCNSLASIDVSNFNTMNVANFDLMFYGCLSLVSLDLSSFVISDGAESHRMCAHCLSLTTLKPPVMKANVTIPYTATEEDHSLIRRCELLFIDIPDVDEDSWN